MADLPKNQHYVPQFLLRGFVANKTEERIFVFDKPQERIFCTSIRNVAAETGFYNYTDTLGLNSVEPHLASLEANCATIIKRINDEESLDSLTHEERCGIAVFTAIQSLRVKQMRLAIEALNNAIRKNIISAGGDPATTSGFEDLDANGIKKASIHNLSIAKELVPHILRKAWLLLRAPSSHPFYLSDNPVALNSSIPQS